MFGMACCSANDEIIRREKDIYFRLFRTCKVQRVIGTKTERFECVSPFNIRGRQLDRYVCSGEHVPDTMPSFMIRCVVDLFLYDGATDPLPFARIAVLQYQ